jgi:hypothetical protein
MPKLTVRFLIDGNQVDKVEAEEPNETDLRGFITRLKDSLRECVTDLSLDSDIDEGFARLMKDAQERRERSRGGK